MDDGVPDDGVPDDGVPDDRVPDDLADLLTGLTGRAREARAALVRDLFAAGHDPDELRVAHAAGRLAMLPVTDALADDGGRTLAAIAADHGLTADAVAATRRSLGLPVDPDGAVYGATAERLAVLLRDTLAVGVTLEALLAFNHVIGPATAAIASGARDAVRDLLANVDPDGDEYTRARHAAVATTALQPVLLEVVAASLAEHLREVGRHEVAATLVGGEDVVDVAVGFADLVGFTALGETVEPRQLGAVAVRLADLARDALVDGCDLVKTLGDGVMFASRRPRAVLTTVLALADAVAGDPELPELRAGLAFGPALPRGGDWYGAVVNRASRLAGLASPGAVVVDDALHAGADTAGGGRRWTDLGAVAVRGLREPVRCWSTSGDDAVPQLHPS